MSLYSSIIPLRQPIALVMPRCSTLDCDRDVGAYQYCSVCDSVTMAKLRDPSAALSGTSGISWLRQDSAYIRNANLAA